MARKKKKKTSFDFVMGIIVILFMLYLAITNESKADIVEFSGSGLEVHFIDVGQADSILLHCKDENVLIDAGDSDSEKVLIPYFDKYGITSFKYVFGTHAHEDHIGSMDEVILKYNIGAFYMPDVITTTKTFENVLDALEKKGNYFDTPKIDEEFNICEGTLKVLYVGTNASDLNSTSIILKLMYGNNSFLFTGDATSDVEKEILNKDIKADVLKVAHHGSKYSTTLGFLKAVSPKYAVISVGKDNSYGHPGSNILKRLDSLGVKTYRTDEVGTIIMESDGNDILVKTEK